MTAVPESSEAAAGDRRSPAPTRRWVIHETAPTSWWPDVLLILGFLALSSLLLWPSPFVEVDVAIRDFVDSHRPTWAYWIARVFNLLGQGLPLAIVAAVLIGWRCRLHRTIRPALMYGVTYAFVGLVILPKIFLDRVAPHWPDAPPYVDAAGAVLFSDILDRQSYPSGHAVNTVVWYFLIVIALGDRLTRTTRALLIYLPPSLVFLSQTYLGFHWVTDTPAGLFLGILIVRIIARVPWATMPLGFLSRLDPGPQTTPAVEAAAEPDAETSADSTDDSTAAPDVEPPEKS
ncbi:phosphatase PAP2 family protein [Stackebrandtia soli]|uniref:phosphatase PAP2 family protein n=1 Tax=Stackebrandtia soli TaxID=1892856 RepID=UPI0039EA4039